MYKYFKALLGLTLFTVVLLGSAPSYAKVKTIEGFSGFTWGLSADDIKQRMIDFSYAEEDETKLVFPRRSPTKEELDAIFGSEDIDLPKQKLHRLDETVIGFKVKHKVFEFDNECGFFTVCRLIKGHYELTDRNDLHNPEKVERLISALNRKYGEALRSTRTTKRLKYYALWVDYEFRDLYWFAEDDTYIKLTFGIVIGTDRPFQDPAGILKNGQIGKITLSYSGVSDIEIVESAPPKELGI